MFLLIRTMIVLPFRVAIGLLRLGVAFVRAVGVTRVLLLAAGVVVGLALAPSSGKELRRRLTERVQAGRRSSETVAARVRHELAHSPRTWHLPQPTVTVAGDTVTLHGEVPHQTGREDLGRVAGAVSGVASVDNQVVVTH